MRACDYSVFKFLYSTTYAERILTYGGKDSELTGKQLTEEREYLCIAPTMEFATTAFLRYHRKDVLLESSCIGQLSDIVSLL